MAYFGEALKTCSNVLAIFISINRYMLVGKEHSQTLKNMSEWNMAYVIAVTVVFSFLINVGHVFQYRLNYGWGIRNEMYPLQNRDELISINDIYPITYAQSPWLGVYTLIFFLFNFVFLFAVNTRVDVVIVRKLGEEIADKKIKLEEEIKTSQSKNAAQSDVVNKVIQGKQKKIEQDAKKETRAIVMVIVNSFLNFFLRLSEIFVFMSDSRGLFPNNQLANFLDSITNLSNLMVSISYFAYILTFTTNVAVYCVFNKKFKQLFILWEYNVKIK
jgi:hypothetical protein